MKKSDKKFTIERKQQLPTAALWVGAIIAPVLCITSVLELIIDGANMNVLGIIWSVFVIGFTAFYSVDFARQLRVRLKEQGKE
ncbi:MAG: hypothetical protein JWO35_644 [Candidatus Saccharibacteria bacterium]|nr:hypothetical protein [Candidatus Saccharibacteria bacterium]